MDSDPLKQSGDPAPPSLPSRLALPGQGPDRTAVELNQTSPVGSSLHGTHTAWKTFAEVMSKKIQTVIKLAQVSTDYLFLSISLANIYRKHVD